MSESVCVRACVRPSEGASERACVRVRVCENQKPKTTLKV